MILPFADDGVRSQTPVILLIDDEGMFSHGLRPECCAVACGRWTFVASVTNAGLASTLTPNYPG